MSVEPILGGHRSWSQEGLWVDTTDGRGRGTDNTVRPEDEKDRGRSFLKGVLTVFRIENPTSHLPFNRRSPAESDVESGTRKDLRDFSCREAVQGEGKGKNGEVRKERGTVSL